MFKITIKKRQKRVRIEHGDDGCTLFTLQNATGARDDSQRPLQNHRKSCDSGRCNDIIRCDIIRTILFIEDHTIFHKYGDLETKSESVTLLVQHQEKRKKIYKRALKQMPQMQGNTKSSLDERHLRPNTESAGIVPVSLFLLC